MHIDFQAVLLAGFYAAEIALALQYLHKEVVDSSIEVVLTLPWRSMYYM